MTSSFFSITPLAPLGPKSSFEVWTARRISWALPAGAGTIVAAGVDKVTVAAVLQQKHSCHEQTLAALIAVCRRRSSPRLVGLSLLVAVGHAVVLRRFANRQQADAAATLERLMETVKLSFMDAAWTSKEADDATERRYEVQAECRPPPSAPHNVYGCVARFSHECVCFPISACVEWNDAAIKPE